MRRVRRTTRWRACSVLATPVARWRSGTTSTSGAPRATSPASYSQVSKAESGPHDGGGDTIGHSFFANTPNLHLVFRKRELKPGAAIGYHPQKEDEVYYILSGTGVMQMNGKEFPVKPGDAILTRPGSSHGLKQTGKDDLALIIVYEK